MRKGQSRGFVFFGLMAVAALVVILSGGRNLIAAPKQSCVTADCHSKMGKDKFVHGPVSTGDCDFCHKPIGQHKFKPTPKNVSELCYQCHDKKDTMKTIHKPVKDGNCTACHSPHQSPNKYQLRAAGSDLCFMCHNRSLVGGKYVHGPAAVGSCTVCHDPHQSDNPRMLVAKGDDVCFACHSDKLEEFKTKKYMHPPVKEACWNCHSPHSAGYKYNLKADPRMDLCLGCHKGKKKEIEEATVKHGALNSKTKCLTCHDPHVSDYPKMLRKPEMDLCLSCHDKELTDNNGKKILNMKAYLEANKDVHGPIREKDCTSCHNPHGSSNFRMLRAYFPPVFYAPYDPKNYALCFMCHENTLAADKRTTTLTNFRNGDLNLHYLHVHKLDKGRTCRACHDPHASNNPKHIRDYVPFGAWKLPINYKKTPTGGQCSPGCHQTFRYDRVNPVVNRK